MLVDGEIRTLEGRVVGRTYENIRHYDFKVGDNIFHNIEYHMRELGHGDVSVNKNMKNLNKIFYDILYNVDQDLYNTEMSKKLLVKYFFSKDNSDDEKAMKLANYFQKFRDFCFDLDVNNMLNGSINFNYR